MRFKGLVVNVGASKDNDYEGSVVVRGYSPDYLLTDGTRKRTFIKKSIDDIFNSVLKDYPPNVLERKVQAQSKSPVPFAMQYNESNFAFLSRLAAEHGEWFYYDGRTLQLGSPAAGSEEVNFVADGDYNSFSFGITLKPAKVQLYEYSYLANKHFKSQTTAQAIAGIQKHPYGGFALAQSETLFANAAHLLAQYPIEGASELDEEALLMRANIAADLITFQGHSDNPQIQLGSVLNVSGEGIGSRHIATESFGKYRVLSITHEVDAEGNYSNNFVAIPFLAEIPPINPHYIPPHGTPELAEVIDDADPQKLGRLRVRYHWPVDKPQDAETDWIRLLTPYSGNGKGQLFKPEVGSQVLVGYQGGLAEQPLVLGNLFHANNQQGAKYSPDGNLMKGLQTAGGNKFVMMDKAGEQKIHISNSNNKGTAVEVGFNGDGSITIKSNGPVTVLGSTITLEAGDKGEIHMHAKNVTIDAEEEIKVTSASKSIALKAEKDITADATANMNFSAKTKTVSTTGKLEISSGSTVDISGSSVKIND